MAIEQTRFIGFGAYSGQSKVFDQARQRTLEGLVARRFVGRVLGLSPGEDGGLRSAVNVRLVADVPVLVVRPVVPGQRAPGLVTRLGSWPRSRSSSSV